MPEIKSSPKKACFVVGPIGQDGSEVRNHSDWLFQCIIKPAVERYSEFEIPVRADKIAQPGMITTQIIKHLLDDDLVIADLSLGNANAFYEIGIRHMVEKPIVHMLLKGETGPFDTSGFRAVPFSRQRPDDLIEAAEDLAAAIKIAVAPDHEVENPVTHARGRIKLEQSATPEQKIIVERFRSMEDRLGALEVVVNHDAKLRALEVSSTMLTVRFKPESTNAGDISHVVAEFLRQHGFETLRISYSIIDNIVRVRISGLLDRKTLELIAKSIMAISGVVSVEY